MSKCRKCSNKNDSYSGDLCRRCKRDDSSYSTSTSSSVLYNESDSYYNSSSYDSSFDSSTYDSGGSCGD